MSEVITGVVKLTFGFLANKIRDEVAERLKDGDVTDEECRRLIVRELDDIKRKLDGLARKDLLSSFLFLQEGVNRLFQSLLQVDSNENTAESPDQATLLKTESFKDTGSDFPMNEAIALVNAITSLEIHSNDQFKSAIESFKLARQKATEAFANEGLSIEDRIQASQVRMMARILENLEGPEACANDCLQYLKQLHDIGAIREIFSVLIKGGMKSKFNKTKRLNNGTSIQVMNQVLFEFIKKFTKSSLALLPKISAWPTILLGEETYYPLIGEDRLFEKLEKSGMQLDSRFTFDDKISPLHLSVVNSKGDIVALMRDKHTFKVFKRSGESRNLCKVSFEACCAGECNLMAMDIDAEDNLYIIAQIISRQYDKSTLYIHLHLFVFDKNGEEKNTSQCLWNYASCSSRVYMAVHKYDREIAIAASSGNRIILHIGGKSVSLVDLSIHTLRFSSFDNTIVIASSKTVYIYTGNGELQRTIEIPRGHKEIKSVAINHAAKHILVKTYQEQGISSLLSFSVTGELHDCLCLGFRKRMAHARLLSHPNGLLVLVHETGATLFNL